MSGRSFSSSCLTSALALVVVAACQRDTIVSPNAVRQSITNAPSESRTFKTLDERYAALVDQIPGFGGLFYDSSHRLTVFMKDTTQANQARPVLVAFLNKERGGIRPEEVSSYVDGMRLLKATYDYRELLTLYQNVVIPSVINLPGLVTTDIDESRNMIVLGVSSAAQIDGFRAQIAKSSAPVGLVDVIVQAIPRMNSSLTDSLRPVPGGARIWQTTATDSINCTVGYNLVNHLGTISDTVATDRYFVTASHCSATRNSVDGTQWHQASGYIGSETGDPAAFTNSQNSSCPVGKVCRYADASLVTYTSPSLSNDGKIAYAGLGSLSFSAYINVVSVQSPPMGFPVNMIGATSGRTFGTVTGTCVNVTSIAGWTNGELLCQGEAQYSSASGDSGAPVIELHSDSTAWADGVHWGNNGAGTSFFSTMDNVLGEFFDKLPGHPNFRPEAP